MKHRRADLIQARVTAVHEGGHGCTAVALGLRFKMIDIIANKKDNRLGRINWSQDLWRALKEESNRG
jgi:hypothetical protein